MRRVLAHIHDCSERFAREPMFKYLRDDRVDLQQRLCFMPMMAHFVFSFMDVNRYILRNEAVDTPFQRLINIHSYEDANWRVLRTSTTVPSTRQWSPATIWGPMMPSIT